MTPAKPTGRSAPSRRGFVLITTVLSIVVLLAFLGLAVDVGYLEFVKTRMQTAADAAALGGTQEFTMNGAANVVAVAKSDAARNGFTDGQNSVTIAVHNPPASGYYTSDPSGVEVIISQSVSTFFAELVGSSSLNVQARAAARQGSATSCLYALDPAAPSSFSASGGVTVQVNCGVMVNSSSLTALNASGGSHVNAAYVDVYGGYSISGGSVVSPAPTLGPFPQNDPLSYVAPPAVGGCTDTNTSVSGGATRTLAPGVYCNGISVSGGSHVTFAPPGTYILNGGGLNVSGGSSLSGTGVMFYNTGGGGHTYQPINISGGTAINLSAPTAGPLAGMLFFQDRGIVSSSTSSFSGGADTVLNGALYFPTTPLSYSGGTSGTYTIIVAKTVSFSGGATLNNNYSSLPGGSPVKGGATLSE